MGNGELKYSMGMEGAGFATGLNQGLELLHKFGAAAQAVAEVVTKEWEHISEQFDLSKILRTSVADVYGLEHALRAATGSGAGVESMISGLRRALAGTDDEGGRTAGIFAAMGLDPDQLKGQGPMQQIEAVLVGLNKLDDASKQLAARRLFRGGAQDALKASVNLEDFSEGARRSQGTAVEVERIAAATDEVMDNWGFFVDEIGQAATRFAVELLPLVRDLAEIVAGLDLAEWGTAVGSTLTASVQSAVQTLGEIDPKKLLLAGATGHLADTVLPDLMENFAENFNDAVVRNENMREAADAIASFFKGGTPEGTGHINSDRSKDGEGKPSFSGGAAATGDVDPFTRIGALLYGSGSVQNHQQQIAENTKATAVAVKEGFERWRTLPGNSVEMYSHE